MLTPRNTTVLTIQSVTKFVSVLRPYVSLYFRVYVCSNTTPSLLGREYASGSGLQGR
jgi:hypothetical protein